jgi:hypothetical protein
MTTPTLPDQLRALVDQVEAPTFADIRAYAVTPRAHRRAAAPRRRVVAALAAVLLLVAVSAVTFALVREDHDPARRVGPAVTTGNVELPPDCVVTTTTSPGCDMTADEAAQFLGFQPRTPSGIPEGWVKIWSRLRVYRNPLPDGEAPLPAGVDNVGLFMQIWAPPGTDLNATGTCPDHLSVRERIMFPGEGTTRQGQVVDLGNGTLATGSVESGTSCGGTLHDFGMLSWYSDGEWIALESLGIPPDQVLAIARSVDR